MFDARLQHWLRKFIPTLPVNEQIQLRNIRRCNTRPNPNGNGVFFVRSSSGKVRVIGLNTCKNPFACPHCTAVILRKNQTRISCALAALEKEYSAVMVTFTIPHLMYMSCKETTDILYQTWRTVFSNKNKERYNADGSFRPYNPANLWYHDAKIKYSVRGTEYTYGKNGWHPHFHAIFWFPKHLKEKFYEHESTLNEYWLKIAKIKTQQYWEQHSYHQDKDLDDLYKYAQPQYGYGVMFSKHETTNATYLAAIESRELTGERHKTHYEGHLDPYQILELAANGSEKHAQLYREFMLHITRKPIHRRFEYSKNLIAIATNFKNSQQYTEILKKKPAEDWQIVGWLQKEAWLRLYYEEIDRDAPIISNLLYLIAKNPTLIDDFLAFYGITMQKNRHFQQSAVEKLFNIAA